MEWMRKLLKRRKDGGSPKPLSTPESLAERFKSLYTPALHLRETEDASFSRIGGLPLLPDSLEWPEWKGMPLSFLAQIDLAQAYRALPSFLPESGALYFFYDQEQSTWGFDPNDVGSWRVLYWDGDPSDLRERPLRVGPEELRAYPSKRVRPRRIETVPDFERLQPYGLDWAADGDAFDALQGAPFENLPRHQLLGYPTPIQGSDMELECQMASNGIYMGGVEGYRDPRRAQLEPSAVDWKLLFQLDTDDDTWMMWGDMGMLYFWIREQDARDRRFDNVWMILQCG